MKLSSPDYEDLKYAKRLLTSPSLSSKLISKLGAAFEKSLRRLPTWWNTGVQLVAVKALTKTLKLAVLTMGDEVDKKPSSEKT